MNLATSHILVTHEYDLATTQLLEYNAYHTSPTWTGIPTIVQGLATYITGRLNIHLQEPSCEEVGNHTSQLLTTSHKFDLVTIRLQEHTETQRKITLHSELRLRCTSLLLIAVLSRLYHYSLPKRHNNSLRYLDCPMIFEGLKFFCVNFFILLLLDSECLSSVGTHSHKYIRR